MVNVHIHQFQPGGAVVDAAALAQFQEQWATYRKLVESDCLAHCAVTGNPERCFHVALLLPRHCLRRCQYDEGRTARNPGSPLSRPGTQVRHYHGIDLSQAALDLAAANLAELPFEIDLDHRDFVEAMMRRPEHADASWCSLSIHHLSIDDKLRLIKVIRGATGTCGILRFGSTAGVTAAV